MNFDIKSVGVSIGNKNIIDDISFKVEDKDFIGIIGPNGSGKSTFLKCLYRNIRQYKGTVLLDGINLEDITVKESARKISTVAQHSSVDFDISVLDMVLLGRSPYKKLMDASSTIDRKLSFNALKKVDMLPFIDRNFNSLSGGEKQRVILARALCQDTECLILDEPTNHLDIKYQLSIFNILKSMDSTVISAVHDLNIALEYCNKIVAMKDGRILGFGKATDIINKELINEIFEVNAEVIDIKGKKRVIYI